MWDILAAVVLLILQSKDFHMSKRLILAAIAALALFTFVAPAGAATGNYETKGGSFAVNITKETSNILSGWFGITLSGSTNPTSPQIGPFVLSSGGSVNIKKPAASASLKSGTITAVFGNDNTQGSTTTLTISKIGITVGKKSAFVTGYVTGTIVPAAPGLSVTPGTYKIFSITGGKFKSGKTSRYKYAYAGGETTLSSQFTNLINNLITPQPSGIPVSNTFRLGSTTLTFK